MKTFNKGALSLVVALTVLLVAGCETKAEDKIEGRFTVLDKFYLFDNSEEAVGKILKDRDTGNCFLYIWEGRGDGGPAIAKIECN